MFMNDKNFYNDYDDEEIHYDNYDDIDYSDKPRKKKNKKNFLSSITISLLSILSLSGIAIGVYYILDSNKSSNSSSETMGTTLSATGKYISQRTLSLQFLIQINGSNAGEVAISSGTGWIINKEKNSNIYYIATNLHVAAMLTYENHDVWSYEENSSTNYGSIQQSLVGYISDYNENNNRYTLSMITVPKPTIAYITAEDSSWTNLSYPQVTGQNSEKQPASYNLESDFAILKYDFSNTNLLLPNITSGNTNPNHNDDVKQFESWLSIYNNNPTKLLNKPIQNVSNWQNLQYSMGGFPSSGSNGKSLNAYENVNYSSNVWREFTNFSIQLYQIGSGMGSAFNVKSSSKVSDPIVYVNDKGNQQKTITDNNSGKVYDNGYVNGAYGAKLSQSSAPGSSGSMVITYIDQQPYVVGIYWGSTTWSNGSKSQITFGAMDFLNTNTNGTSYNGYDLFTFSYNYLTSSKGASLFFDPKTNTIS